MPLYDDVINEVGPPPPKPWDASIFGFKLNEGAMADWRMRQDVYHQLVGDATKRIAEQYLNPFRGATLGEVSRYTDYDPAELATSGQYRNVPPLPEEPYVVQGGKMAVPNVLVPPTFDIDKLQNPRVPRQTVGDLPQDIMTRGTRPLEMPGAPDTPPSRQLDLDAPATLPQQMLGTSTLYRQRTWPRSIAGQAGVQTFDHKVRARAAAIKSLNPDMPEAQAANLAAMELTGGTQDERDAKLNRLYGQTELSNARVQALETQMGDKDRQIRETIRHNQAMEALSQGRLAISRRQQDRLQQAMDNRDWLAVQRLNETRHYNDLLFENLLAADKAGRFGPEREKAALQGLDLLGKLEERDLTPEEQSTWERIKSYFGFQPRGYAPMKPREPLQVPGGVAPPMNPRTTPGQSPLTPEQEKRLDELRKKQSAPRAK